MITWGVSARGHDAGLAVFRDDVLAFAAHAERYSRVKNDADLSPGLVADALRYGQPDLIVWYERPWFKKTRQAVAGQWAEVADREGVAAYMRRYIGAVPRIRFVGHHESHAAAGYYTSPFRHATIVVLDAIGEWQTYSIWEGSERRLTLRYSQSYPHSIGLWYSAMTQRCGFKPNEEEYIMMGMASFGDPRKYYDVIKNEFLVFAPGSPAVRLRHNLHRGCRWWAPEITDLDNVAAAVQRLYQDVLLHIASWAREHLPSDNLVVMGGCALNCVANSALAESGQWNDIWIMPSPGDAGSSVGSVLAHRRDFIAWPGPFLGHEIDGAYPVAGLLERLRQGHVVGVASGRAEFGPRALGNRSLLADPRLPHGQWTINRIKRRETFRPFAPAILSERAQEYFDLGVPSSPYMQYTARCRNPSAFPAIVHVDGTSRVQTVSEADNPGFYRLLKAFDEATNCPLLLNTSLNVKGEPLVNDVADAQRFTQMYDVPVLHAAQ